VTPLPSFDPGFSTPAMTDALAPERFVGGLLAFEAGLAAAQADLGLISPDVAAEIGRVCSTLKVEGADILVRGWEAGTPLIPLLDDLRGGLEPEAASAVHAGATSQDAIDTALALQVRVALGLLRTDQERLGVELATLADAHRHTGTMARTLLQEAAPTSLGLRIGRWLQPFRADLDRLRAAETALPVQLGGPVGDQSDWGRAGPALAERLAHRLHLAAPAAPWHSDRRPLLDAVRAAAASTRSVAKVATDLVLLSALGEVRMRAGGSSSLPDKRNPIDAVRARAAAAVCQPIAAALVGGSPVELERGAGGWQSEWLILPMVFHTAAAAVSATSRAIESFDPVPGPAHGSEAGDAIIDQIIDEHRIEEHGTVEQREA
jgi:3-carboxy-cis,cis-muconate cycloisomerase